MDISWHPTNLKTSSRSARTFALNATVVFTAEELCAYVDVVLGAPSFQTLKLPTDPDRVQKLSALSVFLGLPEDHLLQGPLLLLHWRNRIIHRRSNASLTRAQRDSFIEATDTLGADYKNLNPVLVLDHFRDKTPTLKDVSSLVAMTINCVKRIEAAIPKPKSAAEVLEWIAHLGLSEEFDRVKRVSAAQPNPEQGVAGFFATHCPELQDAYALYGAGAV